MASIKKRELVRADGKRVTKYDACVTKKGARRQTKTFTTRAAAEKWARRVEGDIEAGSWVDQSAAQLMTVARALDIYLVEVVPHLKSQDALPYQAKNIKRRLGNRPLSSLTSADLAEYRDDRLKDRARRGTGRKDGGTVELDRLVSPQTVKHELGLVNLALAHVEHAHNVSFPRGRPHLDHRRNNALSLPPGRDRILDADEKVRLMAACTSNQVTSDEKYAGLKTARNPILRNAVEFMIENANRPGEVVVFRWRDANWHEGTVTFKNKKKKASKTPETRTFPMSPRAREILESMPGARKPDAFVFGGITRSALYQAFRRALKRAKIEDFSTRDLRHVGATRLASVLKGDLLMLADITGHNDIRLLRRYVAPRRAEISKLLNDAPPAIQQAAQAEK
ncbi:MAG: Shufflon-specific recombinase [Nevskia sp.]|nr:Shufflon-specific recombinase [Nevskia sp.]